MTIQRKSFERQTLDEEYSKADIVKCRLNKEERLWLDALKLWYKTPKDSTALKNEAFKLYKQHKYLEQKSKNRR